MGRPERPLDPRGGPLVEFARALRDLRKRAKVSYRQMADRVPYSASTLAKAANGQSVPNQWVTEAYVKACGGGIADIAEWEKRRQRAAFDHDSKVRTDRLGDATTDRVSSDAVVPGEHTPRGESGQEQAMRAVERATVERDAALRARDSAVANYEQACEVARRSVEAQRVAEFQRDHLGERLRHVQESLDDERRQLAEMTEQAARAIAERDAARIASTAAQAGAEAAERGWRRELIAAVGSPGRTGLVEKLAAVIQREWEDESRARHLYNPYPLPVRWKPADPRVMDDWPSLVRLASTSPGARAEPTWAAAPEDLPGIDDDLSGLLGRIPTGRLVVLGEPGAGKTVLLVRLALDLLNRRTVGQPLPVLMPLASWNPVDQPLPDWIEAQLCRRYPSLRKRERGVGAPTRARELLDGGLILPLLDGLDEMHETGRGPAIARINDALRPGQHLVLTARSAEYREAVRPTGGVEVTLTGAAGIELCPLETSDVAEYLRSSAGGPMSSGRWQPVFNALALTPPSPIEHALSTPLGSTLARAAYNPSYNSRPGEHDEKLFDPSELCDQKRFGTTAAVKTRLFDAFISAAYRRDRDAPWGPEWRESDARRWLAFLALHIETRRTTDLAWWDLWYAVPRRLIGLAVGLPVALAAGIVGGAVSVVTPDRRAGGLALGIVSGLAVAWAAGHTSFGHTSFGPTLTAFAGRPRLGGWLLNGVAGGFVGGLIGGLFGGLFGGLLRGGMASLVSGLLGGVDVGIAVGIVGGPVGGLLGGFVGGLVEGSMGGLRGGIVGGASDGAVVGLAVGTTAAIAG